MNAIRERSGLPWDAWTRRAGWATFAVALVAVLVLAWPGRWGDVPYYMDDWDFVFQALNLRFDAFLLQPQSSGHLMSFTKLFYGLLLIAPDFRLDGILLSQYACRSVLLAVLLSVLHKPRRLNPVAGLVCLTVVSYAERGVPLFLLGSCASLAAGALSFGVGLTGHPSRR